MSEIEIDAGRDLAQACITVAISRDPAEFNDIFDRVVEEGLAVEVALAAIDMASAAWLMWADYSGLCQHQAESAWRAYLLDIAKARASGDF